MTHLLSYVVLSTFSISITCLGGLALKTKYRSQYEASSNRNGLYLIELLTKGVSWKSSTQAAAKTIACLPQTDNKLPLLSTMHMQPIKDREAELLHT